MGMAIGIDGVEAGAVMQGLRASSILLSRLIVVLEETRADALAHTDHEEAGEVGRVVAEVRDLCARIETLMSIHRTGIAIEANPSRDARSAVT